MERKLIIATAPSRKSRVWKNHETTWPHIVERLQQVARTGEMMAEYRGMTKSQKDERKDVGGFVGGCLANGRRRKGSVKWRDLLTLDLDYAPKLDELERVLLTELPNTAYVAYPTHSSTPEMPRYRIVIPFSRRVKSEEYEPIARRVAEKIGIDYMDSTTYDTERLMYWCSVPQDAAGEVSVVADAEPLDADAVLAQYEDWSDASQWPTGTRENEVHAKTLKKLGDPKEKRGIVGLFCQAYTVREAMAAFIPDVYKPVMGDENRFTYTGGSTTGGAILYDELFLCSHHATDPAGGGHEVNAFDLVRLHKFGQLDADTTEDVPVTQRPSYKAMAVMAYQDERVRAIQSKDDFNAEADALLQAGAAETKEEAEAAAKWVNLLDRNKDGSVKPTAKNVLLILRNHHLLKGIVGHDRFSDRLTVLRQLPWEEAGKTETGRVWADADDSNLRNWFADSYGLSAKGAIDDGLAEMAEQYAFHPARDWLKGLEWDGLPRAAMVFIEFLRAEDTPYTRAMTLVWLKEAVARILHPGCKADITLVLAGPQNIGKSYVLSKLGGKWFSDSLTTVQGKEAMVQLLGVWIGELGEMQATTRASNEEVKAYLTRQIDKFRPPYGKRVQEFPRQCVFAATTNDDIFLKDRTGGRRFGILTCGGIESPEERRHKLGELTPEYIRQVWAEVMSLYQEDPSLLLDDDMQAEASRIQEEHTEGAEKAGLIAEFLDTPRPPDWESKTIGQRRAFLAGEFDDTDGAEIMDADTSDYIVPQRTCAMEILCELFGMERRNIRNMDIREINTIMQHLPGWKKHDSRDGVLRFPVYGRQRAYIRESNGSEQEGG